MRQYGENIRSCWFRHAGQLAQVHIRACREYCKSDILRESRNVSQRRIGARSKLDECVPGAHMTGDPEARLRICDRTTDRYAGELDFCDIACDRSALGIDEDHLLDRGLRL